MPSKKTKRSSTPQAGRRARSVESKIFLGFLGGIATLYGVVLAYHVATPEPAEAGWLEECRKLCAEYGLVPTGNLKADAKSYLSLMRQEDLSQPLREILDRPGFKPVVSQDHPLLHRPALDLDLVNVEGEKVSLAETNRKGPVVLVFYYGYNCSHCVAQLFAIQDDLKLFRELGAEIIAVSPDTPEHTREKYAEYGAFDFPVLSDPDDRVAEAWDVYRRKTAERDEDRKHGTFVIDRDGQVIFANCGYQPFVNNRSLLHWVAGRPAPPAQPVDQSLTTARAGTLR